jgi:Caspase domain/Bacterial SH3 domain
MLRVLKYLLPTLLILVVMSIGTSSSYAAKRLALVIGNNDYKEVPKLEKAVGDSTAIGQKLAELGFDVTTALNLNRRDLNQALSKLYGKIEPGDTVLIQYSGHGVEIAGQNFLLPTDIPLPTEGGTDLLKSESLAVNTLVETLEQRGAGIRILIIDACRDNPFAASGTRGLGGTRGLANATTSKGTFIMYSAGAGQTALDRLDDSDTEPTSVYTRVLLGRLSSPAVKLRDLAASIRDDVEVLGKSVGHEQRPAYYDDLPENFSLAPGGAATDAPQTALYVPPKVIAPAVPPAPSLNEDQAYKLAEGIDTVDGWNVFLEQYPAGIFTPYAKAARDKLVRASLPKPKPAAPVEQQAAVPPTKAVPKPQGDACNRFGKVRGLDPNGDNFLSVRTGPGSGFEEIDRIFTGNGVSICSQQGKWLRVKYGGGRGWVYGKYITR